MALAKFWSTLTCCNKPLESPLQLWQMTLYICCSQSSLLNSQATWPKMWCASILKHDLHHLQNSPAAANIFTFTNWLLRNLHFIWIFKQYFHLQRRSLFLLVQDARSICIFYQCQRPQAFIADCRIVPAHHQAVCPRAKFSVTIAPFLLDTVPVRSNYPVSFPLPTQEGKNI